MKKYKEALETMCRRCTNYEMCQGTGCGPRKTLQELIDDVIADNLLSALGHELGESRAAYMEELMQEEGDQE